MSHKLNIVKCLILLGGVLNIYLSSPNASADDNIIFGTDWYAQAQHGGYYQALATGIYKKFGLDVRIDQGGASINGQELLVSGKYQFYMGTGFGNLVAEAHGLPLVTVATIFQKSPTCIYSHLPIIQTSDLRKVKQILVSSNEVNTWWPWALRKFGLKPGQRGVYTGSVVPFLVDKNVATQGYIGSEDYIFSKKNIKFNTFMLSDYGYPDYTETIETTENMVKNHPDIVRKFIEATLLGWQSYLKNPTPGNKLIMKANPKQTEGQLMYGVRSMLKYHFLTGRAANKEGIGVMTNARWKKIFDVAVENGLVPKDMDYHKAYTLRFIKKNHIHLD